MPPTAAPGANVAHAASAVRRRVGSPRRPIVSTIENPQGDQAPVRPIGSAAMTRTIPAGLIRCALRSAWHVGLVVGHAEDVAGAVAVAVQGGVAIDAGPVVRTAVPELSHLAAATAVPGPLEVGLEAVDLAGLVADLRPGRRGQRVAVGVLERMAVVVHRLATAVHEAADVVDGPGVRRANRVAVRVDSREPERVDTRARRESVAAEVVGVGLSRPD